MEVLKEQLKEQKRELYHWAIGLRRMWRQLPVAIARNVLMSGKASAAASTLFVISNTAKTAADA